MKKFLALCGLVLCLAACDGSRHEQQRLSPPPSSDVPSTDVGPAILTQVRSTCDLEVELLRVSNFGADPAILFSWTDTNVPSQNSDYVTPHTMIEIVPSIYRYVFTGVPSDDLYHLNAEDASISDPLNKRMFDANGLRSDYPDQHTIIRVNGIQLTEPDAESLALRLDDKCNVQTERVTLNFTFSVSDGSEITEFWPFLKLDRLYPFRATQTGNTYQATLTNVPIGFTKLNGAFIDEHLYDGVPNLIVSDMSGTLKVNGTVTLNGVVVNTIIHYVYIIYGEGPFGDNFAFSLYADLIFNILPGGAIEPVTNVNQVPIEVE